MSAEADAIIATLGLRPHPEGGWYAETFRDEVTDGGGRARSTAIYYMLKAGERSRWHRVDAVEFWLFHKGAPLRLSIAAPGGPASTVALGADMAKGERPQHVIPAHAWQAAESLGAYSLVSCIVAPGFEFRGFELAAPGWRPD